MSKKVFNLTPNSCSFFLQVNNLPQQLEKMNELNHLPGFRHDAKLIEETGKFDHSKKEKKRGFPLFNILLNNE